MTIYPRRNFHRKPLLPATRIWLRTTQQTLGLGSQAVPLLGQRLFVSSTVPPARKEHPVSATETPRTVRARLGLQRAPEPPISSVSISTPEGARGGGAAAPTAQLRPWTQSSHAHPSARAGWGHQERMHQGCTWPSPHAGASQHPCTSPCIPVLSLHPCSPLESSGCHSNHSVPAAPATNVLPQVSPVQQLHQGQGPSPHVGVSRALSPDATTAKCCILSQDGTPVGKQAGCVLLEWLGGGLFGDHTVSELWV